MIQLTGVNKSYGAGESLIRALTDVSLTISAGEFVVITGPSGSGKTTLLNLIGGMTWPDEGALEVMGHNLRTLSDAALSRFRAEKIGFMFQFQSMLPALSALDNLRLPFFFAGRPDDPELARSLLAEVGLAGREHAFSPELSAGQQRRVCLGRALILQPPLLLADEPTGDLDPETEDLIMNLIAKAHQKGATVLLTTHNHQLRRWGSRHLRLEAGKITEKT